LNRLSVQKKDELISSQLKEASEILSRSNKRIINWRLMALPVNDVIPTQKGEDYQNPSSMADAQLYLTVKQGKADLDNLRLNSFRPIAVDNSNFNIIDGNHRHFAIKHIGEPFIYSVVCEVE